MADEMERLRAYAEEVLRAQELWDRADEGPADFHRAEERLITTAPVLARMVLLLAEAAEATRCSSLSCPLQMDPEGFYRGQASKSVGTAARALFAAANLLPEVPHE